MNLLEKISRLTQYFRKHQNLNKNFAIKNLTFLLLVLFSLSSCEKSEDKIENPETENITFTVIGDVPYGDTQRDGFISLIDKHNAQDASEFVVHVGDIKKGSVPCEENVYNDVSTLLKKIKVPTFIILGDNEYNDCDYPEDALNLWKSYFLNFNENWTFPHLISNQNDRTENFSWFDNKVLFIGLNIVGSSVHDADEWQNRLTQNGNWVKQLLAANKDNIDATVIFSHANMVEAGSKKFEPFTDLFREAALNFGKPTLIINGDGHFWIKDKPWEEKNITRVQIKGGPDALKVIVNTGKENPFSFDNNFLD